MGIFNIFFHAAAITLISVFTYLVTKKLSLTILIATLLSLSVDVLIRVHWPISDSLFFCMATLAFVLIGLVFYKPKNIFLIFIAIVAILVAGLTRPHGLGILLIGITAVLCREQLSQLSSRAAFVVLIVAIASMIFSFFFTNFRKSPKFQKFFQINKDFHESFFFNEF